MNKVAIMDTVNLTTPMTASESEKEAEELKEFEFAPIAPTDDLHQEEQLFMLLVGCR